MRLDPETLDPALPAWLRRVRAARVDAPQDLELGMAALPEPDSLRGIDAAATLLERALALGQRILVVGDFDADGATSTALAVLALRACGATAVDFLVPNRFEYGYGLTPEIVALAAARRPDLLLTVDNGISSLAGVEAARAAGIRVLITDHHLPGRTLPAADAIVNPHQPGCGFPSRALAGVGVMFYVLAALRARLRRSGWFAARGIAEPALADWLDLVALGTVADVVPLDRVNRILVHQGLLRIRAGRARAGLLALFALANRDHRRAVAADLGFAAGPRLNAAGRLDDMSLGIRCLLAEDPAEAHGLAVQLDELNRDRRLLEEQMRREAEAQLAALEFAADPPWGLCLYDPTWHQGIVGLVAGRVRERLHRPAIAFAAAGGGELKGSARSVPGLHIRDALDLVAARNPGLLGRFGGHAAAAGLTLEAGALETFATAFDAVVRELLAPEDLELALLHDGALPAAALTLDSARLLRDAGPWGQHFPEPCFLGEFQVLDARVVGATHLRLRLVAEGGAEPLDAIAFNALEEGAAPTRSSTIRILYRLDVNHFRGTERLQLVVERLL
ncbi:MAG: single-stranded-DNA-specific exonuclease RecJ [Pseudomonadota bacterium]